MGSKKYGTISSTQYWREIYGLQYIIVHATVRIALKD